MQKILKSFGLMVAGGLVSSVLGGGFGALIGWISPDFVAHLGESGIRPQGAFDSLRYGAGIGAVAGLFVGFAATVVALFMATLVSVFGRNEKSM